MENKRTAARKRVLKGAIAIGGDLKHEVPCTIRDMSQTGCKIRIGNVVLPNKFELRIEFDGVSIQSEVVWRRFPDVGIRFIGPIQTAPIKRVSIPQPSN